MANHNPQHTYKQYLVREISSKNNQANHGITLPKELGDKFKGVKMNIKVIDSETPVEVSGTCIILQSGLDLAQFKEEIDHHNIDDYEVNEAKVITFI